MNTRRSTHCLVALLLLCAASSPTQARAARIVDNVVRTVAAPIRQVVQTVTRTMANVGRQAQSYMVRVGRTIANTVKQGVATVARVGTTIVNTVKQGVAAVQTGVGNLIKSVAMPAVKTALNAFFDVIARAGKGAAAAARMPLQGLKTLLGPLGNSFDVEAIIKAISEGGDGFARDARKCVDAFGTLSAPAVGTLVKCMIDSVVKNIPGFGQILAFLKDLGFPDKLGSPEGLLKAFTKFGDFGMKALEGIYKLGLGKLPGMPKLDTITGIWKTAQKIVGTLLSGNGLGDGIAKIIESVMAELADLVPRVIDKFTGFREGVRHLLTLELKSPFEKNDSVQREIDHVATSVLDPLVIVLGGSLKKVVPTKIVDDTIKLVRKPMLAMWSFMMRGMIFGRSLLKQAVRFILPRLIEGATGVAKWMDKLKPPPFVKTVLLAVFDQMQGFFGGIASFMLTLVPDLKATVESVLDSVVAATDDVKSVMGTLGGASAAKTPEDMLKAMAGVSGGEAGEGKGGVPAPKVDRAAITKARADFAAADKEAKNTTRAWEKADNAVLEAKMKGNDAQAKEAAQAAKDASDKAAEALQAARTTLLRVDPDAATERVINTVWERLVEAFLKVVWDGGTAVANLYTTSMTRLTLLVAQVVVAAAGGVGGVFGVTIDWVPLIGELCGTVLITGSRILSEAARNIFNSLVLPELRMLAKDQLVDYASLFVDLWKNPKKREQMQFLGKVLNKLFAEMGPFTDRLRKVRDTVKAGASALYAGPLGGFFKMLPPQLFAAISKAVTKGAELFQRLAVQAAAAVGKAIGGKAKGPSSERKLSLQDIAKLIIAEVKEPVIEYLTSLLPDEPELDDLRRALAGGLGAAADKLAQNPSPARLLNPTAMLGLIGEGLLGAKEGLGSFLAKKFEVPDLAGVIEGAIGRVARLLTTGGLKAEVFRVLQSGPLGIIREILAVGEPGKKSLRDFLIDNVLLQNAPADLQAELRDSLVGSFKLVEEPGALSAVLRGGLRGIIAKVVELSHQPIIKLLLRDFPEGPVTQALREVLLALGAEASSAESPLFTKLTQGGLAGIAGMLLAKEKVAGALAEVLTADLSESGDLKGSLAAAISRTGEKLAQSGLSAQFTKDGIRSLLVDFGKPVAEYLVTRLTSGLDGFPPLASAVKTLLMAAVKDLADSKTLVEALRNVPQRFLARLKVYAQKLSARVQKLAASKAASLRAALASLASSLGSSIGTPRMLEEASAALLRVAKDLQAAAASLPSVAEVLR